MRTRARVLRLERACERRDRLLVGVLEEVPLAPLDLEQMTKVACVKEQLLLRCSILRGPERHAVETARETLDGREQLERAERLQEEGIGAARSPVDVTGAVRSGEENDLDIGGGRVLLQLATVGETTLAGHLDVEHDHVRMVALHMRRSLLGAPRLGDLHVDDLEGGPQESPESRIVIDEQEAQFVTPPLEWNPVR